MLKIEIISYHCQDSGDESSSSSGTDSDSETFSSNTGTSDEDKCREKVGSNEGIYHMVILICYEYV